MYCKNCNVEVEGNRAVCPLCHQTLAGDISGEELFPKTANLKKKEEHTFALTYISIMIVISIVCFLVNFLLPYKYRWSITVFFSLLYLFILVKTFKSLRPMETRVFFQMVGIIALLYSIEQLNFLGFFATIYVVPVVILLTMVVLMLLSFVKEECGGFLLTLLFVSLVGFLPLIYNAVKGYNFTLSIASAVGGGISFLFSIIYGSFCGKGILKEEFKRKFHLK